MTRRVYTIDEQTLGFVFRDNGDNPLFELPEELCRRIPRPVLEALAERIAQIQLMARAAGREEGKAALRSHLLQALGVQPASEAPASDAPAAAQIVNVIGWDHTEVLPDASGWTRSPKIDAIKALREVTGLGLKETKWLIEAASEATPQSIGVQSPATIKMLRNAGVLFTLSAAPTVAQDKPNNQPE